MKGDKEIVKVKEDPDVDSSGGGCFKCRTCGKAYLKLGNLNRHYESKCNI